MKNLVSLIILVVFSLSSHAQVVVSNSETIKSIGMKKQFLHFHNDLTIYEKTLLAGNIYKPDGTLEVYKGKKKIVKNYNTKTKFNGKYSTVVDYLFQEQSFYTINDSRDGNVIIVHLQEFDYNFKKIGEPIKLIEIDDETNKGFRGGNYTLIGNSGRLNLKKKVRLKYHKESERYLLTVEANMYNRLGYLQMFVFDNDFSIITSHSIYAENEKDEFNILSVTTLPHGEFLALISETEKTQINKLYLLHLFDDENHQIHDLRPNKSTLIDTQFSNYGADDKIIISLLSQNSNENLSKGTIQNYTYDCISSELTEKSMEIDLKEVINSEYNSLTTMEIQRIHYLKDKSIVAQLCETNYSYGNEVESSLSSSNMIILKIDDTNDLDWIEPIERYGATYGTLVYGANIDYLTGDYKLEIIFNASETDFKKGFYSPNNYGVFNKKGASFQVIPVKASIDLTNGDIQVERILTEQTLTNFQFGYAKDMEETGVYKMFIRNAGKYNHAVINFKN